MQLMPSWPVIKLAPALRGGRSTSRRPGRGSSERTVDDQLMWLPFMQVEQVMNGESSNTFGLTIRERRRLRGNSIITVGVQFRQRTQAYVSLDVW